MRVTNSMMITNMLSNLNRNLNTMSRKQDELSTGKRVMFASDDPVAAAKILKFKTDLADMNQYSTNTRDAQAWLDATESTIAEMGDVLQRMRELAVKASNGTNTAEDTQKIKEEVTQLRDHLISSGNFNFAGRYLFSSHQTDQELLKADGTYNIPITAQDLADKPVSIYEVSAKENMPVGTHGLSIFGFITEISKFQDDMPDASNAGMGAQKAAVKVGFNLSGNYTADTTTVTVDGTLFTVDKTKLNGSVKALNPQDVLNLFNKATDGATGTLSDKADVYFDTNMNLVIRSKTVGAAGNVTLSAFSGMSNPVNITNPTTPTAMGAVTTPVNGLNLTNTTVTAGANYASADLPDFLGKKMMVTLNGLTKLIEIPNDPVGITTDAQLSAAIQTKLDTAFGAGKVTVNLADAAPISFQTTAGATDSVKPELRIQPIKGNTSELIKEVNDFITALGTADQTVLKKTITEIDDHLNKILAVRADIGARGSRLELINARINENSVTFTRLLSDSQDADMAEVIMNLKNAENVYKSALSVGGRIIQQTLVDFIR